MVTGSMMMGCILSVFLASAAYAMPSYHTSSNNEVVEEQEIGPEFSLNQKSPSTSTLEWIRYLLNHNKPSHDEVIATKRFSDFSVPYLKYKHDKRNDGIWIWMPAQGYVSVPKQQQAMEDLANGKPGKIMRYGK